MSFSLPVLFVLFLVALVVIALIAYFLLRGRRSPDAAGEAHRSDDPAGTAPVDTAHTSEGSEPTPDAAAWSAESAPDAETVGGDDAASAEGVVVPGADASAADETAADEPVTSAPVADGGPAESVGSDDGAADQGPVDPGVTLDAEGGVPGDDVDGPADHGDGEVDADVDSEVDDDLGNDLDGDEPAPLDDGADSTPLYRTLRERMASSLDEPPAPVDDVEATDEVELIDDVEQVDDVEQIQDVDVADEVVPVDEVDVADEVVPVDEVDQVDDLVENDDVEEEDVHKSEDTAAADAADTDDADTDAVDPFPAVRISGLDEVVDGGFGIGSAAPIPDGAQPLGHPIKANVDTKTYQDLHSPWYASTSPDVWFLDAGFAERAGFHRAE